MVKVICLILWCVNLNLFVLLFRIFVVLWFLGLLFVVLFLIIPSLVKKKIIMVLLFYIVRTKLLTYLSHYWGLVLCAFLIYFSGNNALHSISIGEVK